MAGTLINSFQARVTDALKSEGLISLSAGVTSQVPSASDYSAVFGNITAQVDKTQSTFGPRTADRYSNSVGDTYRDQRFKLLSGFEGVRTRAYPDTAGPAIGLGFNFNRPNAKALWDNAIGTSVSFNDAKTGKATITPGQAKALFEHDVLYAESVVDKAVGGRALTQNQRLALVSVAYNAPARVASWSDTLRTGTPAQIQDLILTKSYNPNNPYADQLKQRRYSEASLFGGVVESKDVMPTFAAFNSSVKIDPKTGNADLLGRQVGTANIKDLHSEFQGRLENLIQGAPPDIKAGLGIYSGYRSVELQTKLWNDALKKYGSPAIARKWVAPPDGYGSNHMHGLAADLAYNGKRVDNGVPPAVVKYLHENAPKYGLSFPLGNEAWHIEPIEARQKKPLAPLSGLQPIPNQPAPSGKTGTGKVDPTKQTITGSKLTDANWNNVGKKAGAAETSRSKPYADNPSSWGYIQEVNPLAAPAGPKGKNIFVGPEDPLVTQFYDHFGRPAEYNEIDAKADTKPGWVVAATAVGRPSVMPGAKGSAQLTSVTRPVTQPAYQTTPPAYATQINVGGARPASGPTVVQQYRNQGLSPAAAYDAANKGQSYTGNNSDPMRSLTS